MPDPEYATPKDEADYTAGEDHSWLQFAGLKGDGISSKIDLYKLGCRAPGMIRIRRYLISSTGC